MAVANISETHIADRFEAACNRIEQATRAVWMLAQFVRAEDGEILRGDPERHGLADNLILLAQRLEREHLEAAQAFQELRGRHGESERYLPDE